MDWSPEAKRDFTIQRYARETRIEGVELVDLARHADEAGSLTELVRLTAGESAALPEFTVRQINYSEIGPGVIKAFHLHARQTDVWFVPPACRVLLLLIDVRAGSRTEGVRNRLLLGDGRSRLLRIPPGVAHGCRNVAATTGHIIYFTDLHFTPDPDTCDEGRLPWDFAGPDVWDPPRD
jgi:dTDP-4-dehydrorhamnose 3,5-epimerase